MWHIDIYIAIDIQAMAQATFKRRAARGRQMNAESAIRRSDPDLVPALCLLSNVLRSRLNDNVLLTP